MCGLLQWMVIAGLAMGATQATAQSKIEAEQIERGGPNVSVMWATFTGINSSSLAQQGAKVLTSSGLSWPDGTQAIVTFWKPTQEPYIWANVVRCTDYFDAFMRSTGGVCSIPREQQ